MAVFRGLTVMPRPSIPNTEMAYWWLPTELTLTLYFGYLHYRIDNCQCEWFFRLSDLEGKSLIIMTPRLGIEQETLVIVQTVYFYANKTRKTGLTDDTILWQSVLIIKWINSTMKTHPWRGKPAKQTSPNSDKHRAKFTKKSTCVGQATRQNYVNADNSKA